MTQSASSALSNGAANEAEVEVFAARCGRCSMVRRREWKTTAELPSEEGATFVPGSACRS